MGAQLLAYGLYSTRTRSAQFVGCHLCQIMLTSAWSHLFLVYFEQHCFHMQAVCVNPYSTFTSALLHCPACGPDVLLEYCLSSSYL